MKDLSKRTKETLRNLKKVPHHVKNKIMQVKQNAKQNLLSIHDFMWVSLKDEPADLGTFGGKTTNKSNSKKRRKK
jgi:hypothetical protein